MAGGSSSKIFFGSFRDQESDDDEIKEQDFITESAPRATPQKRKRNQPGTPNPDAEVIALSPATLMATNRFVCEVCHKGFQREQNLQLHRRGHNLPWKLKQKTSREPRRKVYVCPDPNCVHHDPSRALGDLTGIKKHFSRKHGEKVFKCEKCSKKYAVQSDWKAHSKTCGSREYRCDCGTIFSRRDSFITHRAFCEALAKEAAARDPPTMTDIDGIMYGATSNDNMSLGALSKMASSHISEVEEQKPILPDLLGLGKSPMVTQFPYLLGQSMGSASAIRSPQTLPSQNSFFMPNHEQHQGFPEENQPEFGLFPSPTKQFTGFQHYADIQNNNEPNPQIPPDFFNLGLLRNESNPSGIFNASSNLFPPSDHHNNIGTSSLPSLYGTAPMQFHTGTSQMSATALLQKAAQLGSTSSNNSVSLLRSFGSSSSSTGTKLENSFNFTELMMSSLIGGGGGSSSSIFGGMGGYGSTVTEESYGGYNGKKILGLNEETTTGNFFSFSELLREGVYHQGSGVNGGGAENYLTRDFLGVGDQMLRRINSMDSETKTAENLSTNTTHDAFGGGFQFSLRDQMK